MKLSSIGYLLDNQLKNQYDSLVNKTDGQILPKGFRIAKCKKYEITAQSIEETAQSIFVNIAKEGNPIKIPKDACYCGGAKGAITIIEVVVSPADQSIEDRIAEYLLNKKTPPAMMSGPMNVYDEISINGNHIRKFRREE